MDTEQPKKEWVKVPWQDLEAPTLTALIESFILREGTDYGVEESRFATKIEQVRKQLETGSVSIVFDPEEDTVTLITERDLKRLGKPVDQ